jgi:hypothetical protein
VKNTEKQKHLLAGENGEPHPCLTNEINMGVGRGVRIRRSAQAVAAGQRRPHGLYSPPRLPPSWLTQCSSATRRSCDVSAPVLDGSASDRAPLSTLNRSSRAAHDNSLAVVPSRWAISSLTPSVTIFCRRENRLRKLISTAFVGRYQSQRPAIKSL